MTDKYTRTIRIGRISHQMAAIGATQTVGVSTIHGYVELLIKNDWDAMISAAARECDGGSMGEALPPGISPALMPRLRAAAAKHGVSLAELCHRLTTTKEGAIE